MDFSEDKKNVHCSQDIYASVSVFAPLTTRICVLTCLFAIYKLSITLIFTELYCTIINRINIYLKLLLTSTTHCVISTTTRTSGKTPGRLLVMRKSDTVLLWLKYRIAKSRGRCHTVWFIRICLTFKTPMAPGQKGIIDPKKVLLDRIPFQTNPELKTK